MLVFTLPYVEVAIECFSIHLCISFICICILVATFSRYLFRMLILLLELDFKIFK